MGDSILLVYLFGTLGVLCVAAILREAYCWYAKINQRIDLTEKQLLQSKETNRLLTLLLQESRTNSHSHETSSSDDANESSDVESDDSML